MANLRLIVEIGILDRSIPIVRQRLDLQQPIRSFTVTAREDSTIAELKEAIEDRFGRQFPDKV